MIDTIYIAMTGLNGYERGLRVIANNTANLNTPGFKGSSLLFSDLYQSTGNLGAGTPGAGATGYGLNTLGTLINFRQGQLQATSSGLDLAVDGLGMFVLQTADGRLHYTRDGQFAFDLDGYLVSSTSKEQVLALEDGGALVPITIAALGTNAARATGNVLFRGNVSSTATTRTISGVTVLDRLGTSHTLSVRLDAVAGSPGTWDVTLLDGAATVGAGQIAFLNGQPDPAMCRVTIDYAVAGQDPLPVTLDFSTNVTSFDSGGFSTIAVASQDGVAAGTLTGATFDSKGVLQLTYSNGEEVAGAQIALARFGSSDAIAAAGDNVFEARDQRTWQTGTAESQGFGSIRSSMLETANVDLSQEFSNLVIMQRGYQASSQVVSTANEMLGELFGMRGK
jgi:flagellar hook protein FlgE